MLCKSTKAITRCNQGILNEYHIVGFFCSAKKTIDFRQFHFRLLHAHMHLIKWYEHSVLLSPLKKISTQAMGP